MQMMTDALREIYGKFRGKKPRENSWMFVYVSVKIEYACSECIDDEFRFRLVADMT